jgi:DNA-binding response OmpR family regulator
MLVVEVEPDLREYLRELLRPAHEVLAADGQEALELLSREAPFDLITTYAMMPRLSGTELLARLKADPARAGVPVLMLTARADDAHRQLALTVGVDDYLTKPFAPAELLARVQALLARHAVRRRFAALPEEAPDEPAAPMAAASVALAAPETTAAVVEAALEAVETPALSNEAGAQLAQWQARVAAHPPARRAVRPGRAGRAAVPERADALPPAGRVSRPHAGRLAARAVPAPGPAAARSR